MASQSVNKNLIANFVGSSWTAVVSLAFIPVYLSLLGAESYGVVGILVSLQAILGVLDLGLSQTLSRELARLSAVDGGHRDMADTARTLEIIYATIAVLVSLVVACLANAIAMNWVNPVSLTRGGVRDAILSMAVIIGLRWPLALYLGGLNGLQRQVAVNLLSSVLATAQAIGAVAVLLLVEPTIRIFLLWQVAMAAIAVGSFRFVFWRSMPTRSGNFTSVVVARTWRFAAGMGGIALLTVVLMQTDKIILTRVLTLSEFGYYSFAASAAAVVYKFVSPVFTSFYPKLTELVTANRTELLIATYHRGCRILAVGVIPVALTVALFAKEILSVWTRDAVVVERTSMLLSLLIIGNALNGLMHLPYALQLAHGWTSLTMKTNVVAVLVLWPAILWATLRWGAVGAAAVWITLNASYLLANVQIMHTRILRSQKGEWYWRDVLRPLVAVGLAVSAIRLAMPAPTGVFPMAITVAIAWLFGVSAALCATPELGRAILGRLNSASRALARSR